MKAAVVVLVFVLIGFGTLVIWDIKKGDILTNPVLQKTVQSKPKPLEKYEIEKLASTKFLPSKIEIGNVIAETQEYSSRYFYFWDNDKRVSGLLNLPKTGGSHPIIIMYRGYIDPETFKTGDGTRNTAVEFAKAGFVTLAPDFLGYGQSDMPSASGIGERFQTYTTAATLLMSVDNLNRAFKDAGIEISADSSKVGIWGHSNGGQITLTVLEITGVSYPTVLWAPVSKPFPYSILYYTDDIPDHGKGLRKVVSDFEKDYDSEKFSLTNYLDKINAPIFLFQGTIDEAVPEKWSSDLARALKDLGKDIEYFAYPGEDHNFTKGSWKAVVSKSLNFFNEKLK